MRSTPWDWMGVTFYAAPNRVYTYITSKMVSFINAVGIYVCVYIDTRIENGDMVDLCVTDWNRFTCKGGSEAE